MEQQRLQILMNKVLEGQASEQEKKELDEWYAAFDKPGEEGFTAQLGQGETAGLQQRMFASINATLNEEPAAPVISPETHPSFFQRYGARLAIAVVLLCVIAGAVVYFSGHRRTGEEKTLAWQQEASGKERRQVLLPDGSAVWLNAGSKLQYHPSTFAANREIWLQGEAYFEVKAHTAAGFSVHAGKLVTQVLGTSFNINAYHSSEQVQVTVASGKVAVRDSLQQLATLLPDEQLTYTTAGGLFTKQTVAAADLVAWISGQLVFHRRPFGEVAAVLEQQFGTPIRFANPAIKDCEVTASFKSDVSLKQMLDMLTVINGNTLNKNEGGYLIGGKAACK